MTDYDERAWELEIAHCDDGDILLSQGHDGNGDEIMVRLHRCHFGMLAHMIGFVPENEVARACERLQDRLALLATLIECHTKPGDPLRAAAAALSGGQPDQLHSTTSLVASRAVGSSLPTAEPRVTQLDLLGLEGD